MAAAKKLEAAESLAAVGAGSKEASVGAQAGEVQQTCSPKACEFNEIRGLRVGFASAAVGAAAHAGEDCAAQAVEVVSIASAAVGAGAHAAEALEFVSVICLRFVFATAAVGAGSCAGEEVRLDTEALEFVT